ncbi:BRO-N domain-containing protein [Pseudomonas sp. NMI760_13]|uniref:BRO-N domain-containing protein n=1 Tax=Pseudomonas sp. NMI760_13 TaxID=2903147 RepID=UPI001E51C098|nr:BRO family protein [Pseudomonas sp. NMI760_13]MCE0916651.1 hypothetical protein [Pseudomonas sp. NMI760_13]
MQTLLLDYQAEHGSSPIRTIYVEGELYISLEDVVLTLARTNSSLAGQRSGLGSLVNAQKQVLDADECRHFPSNDKHDSRTEVFITEPGLYRLISRDSTPASKKFQRWIFHEVLPSVRKYGTYPPPVQQSSEIMSLAQALAQNASLLVKEIAERERLELETNRRFEEHEQSFIQIRKELTALSSPSSDDQFINIVSYCEKEELTIDKLHLSAMCFKICIEEHIEFRKSPFAKSLEDYSYPEPLIKKALEIINK